MKIDAGFHPSFSLVGKKGDGSLRVLPISEWRAYQAERARKGELPRPDSLRVSAEFELVDISNDAAVAKLHYYEGGKQTYIDYITLYRFKDGWKMMSKYYTPVGE